MGSIVSIAALIFLAAHIFLIAFTLLRSGNGRTDHSWLLATMLFSALACGALLLPPSFALNEKMLRPLVLFVALILTLVAFGTLALGNMVTVTQRRRVTRVWIATNVVWALLVVVLWMLSAAPQLGQPDWVLTALNAADPVSLAGLVGLLISGAGFVIYGFSRFYAASLPEIANRDLFWVLNGVLLWISIALTSSATAFLTSLGIIGLFMSVISAMYATISYRVFDIRSSLILALELLAYIIIATAMIFIALYLALSSSIIVSEVNGLVMIGLLALVISVIYVPLRQGIEFALRQWNRRRAVDPTQAAREYSERIAETVELKELVRIGTTTLNRVMQVRRSCLILLNSTFRVKDAVELLVMQPGGEQDQLTGILSVYSPIYTTLAQQREPLSQFEIEYSPAYQQAAQDEQQLFRELRMSAYAPVVSGNRLIAILAAGPMVDDHPFYPGDLQLLATLAQQTGVALRNARLLDDLQHLNKSMQSLNRGLKEANEQLGRLDGVKTDFVTIASHELRTPLAQIRGYTDIIDALNDQGMLDQGQTTSLVGNLRKATERMEELIAAMLDVSQLDVKAMDLRFTETPPESVLRMAIEPLTDAIKQRKLTLSARGLRGLPTIQADLPRLVQAFRNVIVNAIKFTPDGGRIDILASLQKGQGHNGVEHILVEITDTGVGIDKKNLELIFKKFFRTYDPSLHSTGTYKFLGAGPGLGLTIAKGVIEGHGGKIWAESPGHSMEAFPGTTFFVLLPIVTPEGTTGAMTFEGEPTSAERGTEPKPPAERDQLLRARS